MKKFLRPYLECFFKNVVTKTQQVSDLSACINIFTVYTSIYIHKICQINNHDQDQEIQEYHYFNVPFSLPGGRKVPVSGLPKKKCTMESGLNNQCMFNNKTLKSGSFNSYGTNTCRKQIVCNYILYSILCKKRGHTNQHVQKDMLISHIYINVSLFHW